jgi:DNA-directed RNA polymerase specialized sigma24 family protein
MERPGGWVVTVGVNLVAASTAGSGSRGPGPPGVDVEAVAGARVDLTVAQGHLPVDQRMVVVLRHDLGHSTSEAAEVLDRSEEAVRALLARGARSMRAELADKEEERA